MRCRQRLRQLIAASSFPLPRRKHRVAIVPLPQPQTVGHRGEAIFATGGVPAAPVVGTAVLWCLTATDLAAIVLRCRRRGCCRWPRYRWDVAWVASQHAPNNADRGPSAKTKQQPKHHDDCPGTHRQRLDDAVNVADLSVRFVNAIADAIDNRSLLISGRFADRLEIFTGVFSRRRQNFGEMLTRRCRLLFIERDEPFDDGKDSEANGDDGAKGGGEDEPCRRVVFEVRRDCLDSGVEGGSEG